MVGHSTGAVRRIKEVVHHLMAATPLAYDLGVKDLPYEGALNDDARVLRAAAIVNRKAPNDDVTRKHVRLSDQ